MKRCEACRERREANMARLCRRCSSLLLNNPPLLAAKRAEAKPVSPRIPVAQIDEVAPFAGKPLLRLGTAVRN